jgi:HPt (histidine-containing phosphotransfer) domain-containing protein
MDLSVLGSDLGLKEDEFIELVKLFLTTAKKDLHNLNEAYLRRDAEKVTESAHSLRGSSGNLGFRELSEISNTVEQKAIEDDLELIDELIESMRKHIAEIEACLFKQL